MRILCFAPAKKYIRSGTVHDESLTDGKTVSVVETCTAEPSGKRKGIN